ncbi:hypothetical protein BGZ46_008930 [Entomortierella lignicola]|nr:hypothetical protein BGZ46_008930 [Entomortierella lignicola]
MSASTPSKPQNGTTQNGSGSSTHAEVIPGKKDLRRTFWAAPGVSALVEWVADQRNNEKLDKKDVLSHAIYDEIANYVNIQSNCNFDSVQIRNKVCYMRMKYNAAKKKQEKLDQLKGPGQMEKKQNLRSQILQQCPYFDILNTSHESPLLRIQKQPSVHPSYSKPRQAVNFTALVQSEGSSSSLPGNSRRMDETLIDFNEHTSNHEQDLQPERDHSEDRSISPTPTKKRKRVINTPLPDNKRPTSQYSNFDNFAEDDQALSETIPWDPATYETEQVMSEQLRIFNKKLLNMEKKYDDMMMNRERNHDAMLKERTQDHDESFSRKNQWLEERARDLDEAFRRKKQWLEEEREELRRDKQELGKQRDELNLQKQELEQQKKDIQDIIVENALLKKDLDYLSRLLPKN